MPPKPQPWYAAFNQPPRSPAHGRNWKPTPSSHRHPADRTSNSAGADDDAADAVAFTSFTFHKSISYPIFAESLRAPPIPHAGIRAGELTGYRMWWVTDTMELCSLAHHFIWQPGATIEGNIDEGVHGFLILGPQIYGGVYCFLSPDHMQRDLQHNLELNYPFEGALRPSAMFDSSLATRILGVAWGTIKLWGEVVEHECGYRAQFAKLTSLDGSHGVFNLLDLRRKYNV